MFNTKPALQKLFLFLTVGVGLIVILLISTEVILCLQPSNTSNLDLFNPTPSSIGALNLNYYV